MHEREKNLEASLRKVVRNLETVFGTAPLTLNLLDVETSAGLIHRADKLDVFMGPFFRSLQELIYTGRW